MPSAIPITHSTETQTVWLLADFFLVNLDAGFNYAPLSYFSHLSETNDTRAARRFDYLVETPGNCSYMDASDESGRPLRYNNQSPSFEPKN